MGHFKLTLAAALLCGSAALAIPAVAGSDSANASAPAATNANASDQNANDANANEDANNEDSNNNDETASSDSSNTHRLSTPEEKAQTASLNQSQVAANGEQGRAHSGITRSTMGQRQGGVAGGTAASDRQTDQSDQQQDQNKPSDSNDANGGDRTQ